jgi:hypothetical protein
MHVGTIFQITALLGLPAVHQHANKSRTLRAKHTVKFTN